MLKDLEAGAGRSAIVRRGHAARRGSGAALFALFAANGHAGIDFSGIIKMLRGASLSEFTGL